MSVNGQTNDIKRSHLLWVAVTDTTRFAPSPTGFLHVGHAYAAIRAHALAAAGRFLVRIEDLDTGRCRSEYVDAIFEDLSWLGLTWEQPVLRQSARTQAYRDALLELKRADLTYPCFCTRREIADEVARAVQAPHDEGTGECTVRYPGTCRTLTSAQQQQLIAAGRPYAVRLDARRAAERSPALTFLELGCGLSQEHRIVKVRPLLFGDIVLARKDLPAAYHLAVVVDDAFQGVTLVSRGGDLLQATHVQRLLQSLLRLTEPRYLHHPLILDEHGRKFSKRHQATTLRALRALGIDPAQLRQRLLSAEDPALRDW
jgi:glutamyl-Q tRNA(Asp) synthetase